MKGYTLEQVALEAMKSYIIAGSTGMPRPEEIARLAYETAQAMFTQSFLTPSPNNPHRWNRKR